MGYIVPMSFIFRSRNKSQMESEISGSWHVRQIFRVTNTIYRLNNIFRLSLNWAICLCFSPRLARAHSCIRIPALVKQQHSPLCCLLTISLHFVFSSAASSRCYVEEPEDWGKRCSPVRKLGELYLREHQRMNDPQGIWRAGPQATGIACQMEYWTETKRGNEREKQKEKGKGLGRRKMGKWLRLEWYRSANFSCNDSGLVSGRLTRQHRDNQSNFMEARRTIYVIWYLFLFSPVAPPSFFVYNDGAVFVFSRAQQGPAAAIVVSGSTGFSRRAV